MNDIVRQSCFHGNLQDRIFNNITGMSYMDDVSLSTTLRALLANRIPSNESIHAQISTGLRIDLQLGARPDSFIISKNVDGYLKDMNRQCEKFLEHNEGFERVECVTTMFKNSFNICGFINREKHISILFIERLTVARLHFIQATLIKMLPWFFENNPLTDQEKNLILTATSNQEGSADKYIKIAKEIYDSLDIESRFFKESLNNFGEYIFGQERARTQSEIDGYYRDLNSYRISIERILKTIRELSLKLSKAGDEDYDNLGKAVYDYISKNNYVQLIDINHQGALTILIKDYLTIFDEQEAERCINNSNSYFYHYADSLNVPIEKLKSFYKRIFITKDIKVRMMAAYQIGVGRFSGFKYSEHEYKPIGGDYTYMINPHIGKYGCVGDYFDDVTNALANMDFVSAMELCIASCRSLNVVDPSVNEFIGTLCGAVQYNFTRCLELPDGTIATLPEALDYIDKEKASAEENKEEDALNEQDSQTE